MPRNLSLAEVENHIISAIEQSDAPMGEQDPVWEQVYSALNDLRELAGTRDLIVRGVQGEEAASMRARNAMAKSTDDPVTVKASQADVDVLLARVEELETRVERPILDASNAESQLDELGQFLCRDFGGMVTGAESVSDLARRLLTQQRFFHHKGKFYRHIADGQFCTGREYFRVVVYRDEAENRVWVRRHDDFHEELGRGVRRFRPADDNESSSGAFTWTCPGCGRRFLCAPGYVFCPECDEVGDEVIACQGCGVTFTVARDEVGQCPACGLAGRDVS